jgi:23S rRNA (adenine2030-N6)-methyltransferase
MNYRHAYHAGNFADVFKHSILALLIERLKEKDKPFCVLDTHAGLGVYDLQATEPQKTMEYTDGIGKVLATKTVTPLLTPYLDIVQKLNHGDAALKSYPGSPWVARALLRPQDRLVLTELHAEDIVTLKQNFVHDKQVAVHHKDAYQALKAFLPPKEKRGLVLIDPPFEKDEEFDTMLEAVKEAHHRFSGGVFALWYPIKHRAPVKALHYQFKISGIKKILAAELLLRPAAYPETLNGCGFVIINPPWKIEEQLQALLPSLQKMLASKKGSSSVSWLMKE